MNDKLINKVIKILEISIKDGQFGRIAKIKGDDNLTYTVAETKRDGDFTKAWEQLEKLKAGDTTQVSFVTVDGVIKTGDNAGKTYLSRYVRLFNPDIGNGVANHQKQGLEAKNEPLTGKYDKGTTENNEFWEKKAYKQCLWAYFLTKDDKMLTSEDMDLVWGVFKDIEKDADTRFAKGWEKAEALLRKPENQVSELPIIQQEDINVEDIPF